MILSGHLGRSLSNKANGTVQLSSQGVLRAFSNFHRLERSIQKDITLEDRLQRTHCTDDRRFQDVKNSH
jgi:hypothetical protein